MKLDDLNEEHIVEVVRLYESYCGSGRNFKEAMQQHPQTTLQYLKDFGKVENRIGSKWCGHSKLYFELGEEYNVVVRFNSNFDVKYRKGKEYEAAEKAGEEFVKAAMHYLSSM